MTFAACVLQTAARPWFLPETILSSPTIQFKALHALGRSKCRHFCTDRWCTLTSALVSCSSSTHSTGLVTTWSMSVLVEVVVDVDVVVDVVTVVDDVVELDVDVDDPDQ